MNEINLINPPQPFKNIMPRRTVKLRVSNHNLAVSSGTSINLSSRVRFLQWSNQTIVSVGTQQTHVARQWDEGAFRVVHVEDELEELLDKFWRWRWRVNDPNSLKIGHQDGCV